MPRFLPILCVVALLVASGCASKNSVNNPQYQVVYSETETLDPELTEDWPELKGHVTLTPAEIKALEKKNEISVKLDDFAASKIQSQFVFFNREVRHTVNRWLERSEGYIGHARKVFHDRGMPEELAYLAFIESGYNPKAYSKAGAGGIWQFMPFTGRKYGLTVNGSVDERRDPYKSAQAAADYLSRLYEMFGDWTLALASYNAGEGKIMRAIEITGSDDFFHLAKNNDKLTGKTKLKPETLNYVPKFLAMAKIMENLETLGYEPLRPHSTPDLVQVRVKPNTNLKAMAKSIGVDWNSFHSYNLAFLKQTTPSGSHSLVYVPATKLSSAKDFVNTYKPAPPTQTAGYRVRRGDTLSKIAAKYGVSLAALKKANNRTSNLIREGERLKIPGQTSTASAPKSAPKQQAKAPSSDARPTVYTVQKGDTWHLIAVRNNMTSSQLKQYNQRTTNLLHAGERILVPSVNSKNSNYQQTAKQQLKDAAVKELAASTPKAQPKQTASAPKAAAPAQNVRYRVQKGDTLYSLSRHYGVSVEALLAANGLSSAGALQAGQRLNIPTNSKAAPKAAPAPKKEAKQSASAPQAYKVQSGDTVWSISRKFDVSALDIMKWNNLSNKSVLKPGDKLTVYAD